MIRSSAIWVFVVPIAAKIVSKSKSSLDLSKLVDGLVISLEMPFSLYYLYSAALCFAFANLICLAFCPGVVRRFKDFSVYLSGGGNPARLRTYISEKSVTNITDKQIEELKDACGEELLKEMFFLVRENEALSWAFVRFLVSLVYFIGFFLIGLITYWNFIFVFAP